ncbi:MAG: universal stress protein [Acidobacteria bacterium]|nr:universal stress protein [Acidobacteriota bacterium]NIM62333.1 universal stress protein [Acidobacteriota bacterium]NIO60666.1 universal stress protein [Acidobacteriota bacterium]NIQ85099.1 universal stress protein [Acidobacteriota bacterium]NIT12310.1 universal stress protein [Acidobacteriota bacterium]
MASYETILVTTDLSDAAAVALHHGVELAEKLGSKLIVAFVVDDLPPMIAAHTRDPEELLERHRKHASQELEKHLAEHLAGQTVETVIRQGVAHKEIVALAQERGVDLIVMSMHGHGFLAHALAGSTAERVLHLAPCGVLVIPQRS